MEERTEQCSACAEGLPVETALHLYSWHESETPDSPDSPDSPERTAEPCNVARNQKVESAACIAWSAILALLGGITQDNV
jgi:hypothetical protein